MVDIVGLSAQGVELVCQLCPQLVNIGIYYPNSRANSQQDYDPDSGKMTPDTPSVPNVRFLGPFAVTSEDLPGTDLSAQDAKYLAVGKDIPNLNPSSIGAVSIKNIRYNVTSYKPVPGGSVHIFFVRKQ